MKTTKYFLALLTVITVMACSKDDAPETPKESTKPPTEIPTNKAPAAFDLIDVADGSDGIDLLPAFSWKAAVDPEGEAVTYDLYLDEQEDPATLVATNLTEPTFAITDSLHLIVDYHWKIVAKDAKGASVSSVVNTFTTRTLNFPDEPVTDDAGFSKRYGHSMVAFNGSLWIIGGYVDGEYTNDVWQSRNGESWRKVSPDQVPVRDLFQARSEHTTVVFNNKLWVIGGEGNSGARSDVWYSSDGASWTEAIQNAAFTPRWGHASVVFHDRLWVIGGNDGVDGYKNDVWSSDDGIRWVQENSSANFSPRSTPCSTVVFQNKIWVIGGYDKITDQSNDVWSSADGVVWTEVTPSAEFPPIWETSAVVFDDKIMLVGAGVENDSSNVIWYTNDGKNWSAMNPTNDFPELIASKATVFQNKIWINNPGSKQIWALN